VKLVRLGPEAVTYRFLTPKWAHLPASGAGAAQNGGRFNRPGFEAIYLAADVDTALAEYRQGASIVPPGTLVAYRLDLAEVVDFSAGYDPETWPPLWAQWACDWKAIARIDDKVPPTWTIADRLIEEGRRGLLFPSTRQAGGINLVVFVTNLAEADSIEPHDPEARLPRNQSSWVVPE
jgi:RES domain-containing protein